MEKPPSMLFFFTFRFSSLNFQQLNEGCHPQDIQCQYSGILISETLIKFLLITQNKSQGMERVLKRMTFYILETRRTERQKWVEIKFAHPSPALVNKEWSN